LTKNVGNISFSASGRRSFISAFISPCIGNAALSAILKAITNFFFSIFFALGLLLLDFVLIVPAFLSTTTSTLLASEALATSSISFVVIGFSSFFVTLFAASV
jgi:uncharacterized membrane protein